MSSINISNIIPSETRLFKPLKIGNNELQHRIVLAPLTRYRNDEEHAPLPLMQKYYADRASSPGTLIISEATGIAHSEEGEPHLPGFVSDRQVDAWRQVIDAVHAKGGIFFQQIWAMGRAAKSEYITKRGFSYKSSSNVALEGVGVQPEAMTEQDILDTIQAFVDTAKRVVEAGGDGVEIHGAHGYLLDQFLSDTTNLRTDKWGGSIENRARLTLSVVKALVDAIGAEKVALRLSPYAAFQGSEKRDINELYTYIITELKKISPPLAYLSLVEATGDPGAIVFGHKEINQGKTLDFILDLWDNRSPVVVAGGYKPQSAAWAVEEHYKKWDVLVMFGRYFLSNPDLVFRIRNGIELNEYNRPSFYIPMADEGYNDYPFSQEFQRAYPGAVEVAA